MRAKPFSPRLRWRQDGKQVDSMCRRDLKFERSALGRALSCKCLESMTTFVAHFWAATYKFRADRPERKFIKTVR